MRFPFFTDMDPEVRRRYLVTGATTLLALILAWAFWWHYWRSPWTRDGRIRVEVVDIAAEISGKVVDLKVVDNQVVHKGDVLFTIEPVDLSPRSRAGRGECPEPRVRPRDRAAGCGTPQETRRAGYFRRGSEHVAESGFRRGGGLPVSVGDARSSPGQSRANDDPVSGQRLRHQPDFAHRRLRRPGPVENDAGRQRFVLDRRLF